MSLLDNTLNQLAPGVSDCRDIDGRYRPRHGLAIYCLPSAGWTPASPGMVLGEALAGRSGIGCTLLDGIPAKIPEGAVVVGKYADIKGVRPDLLEDVPEPKDDSQYIIKLQQSGLVVANTPEALGQGMQTLAMLVLRHGEETIPGCVITDSPARAVRRLAVELDTREISIGLLMQIVSFAATFKANRIHFILNDDFDPGREVPGIENFFAACASFGIGIGVRLKYLAPLLSGELTIIEAWGKIRAAARAFGATEAALDDVCPGDADPETLRHIVDSAAAGDVGLPRFSLDARAIVMSGADTSALALAGVSGWHRLWKSAAAIPAEFEGIPTSVDVQAPVPGMSSRTMQAFKTRLEVGLGECAKPDVRDFTVSFRDIGVSHLWQNLLYPAGAGLVAAWGSPSHPEGAAERLLALLYGESGPGIAEMWDTVTAAFPPGLSDSGERLFRRTAFGHWPESGDDWEQLVGVDWLAVAGNIRTAAQTVQAAFDGLNRNVGTLMGARLCLYAMSWLHCFTALVPELDDRINGRQPEDGRTEPIAKELFNNFRNWLGCMRETQQESGLEFSEMPILEEMGIRLRGMCEGLLELRPQEDNDGGVAGGGQGSITLD